MIPKTLLNKDLGAILSSKGADTFFKGEFIFKGRFRQNAEVIFEDRAVGYSNTFTMNAKDFFRSNLKLKDIITHKETLKNYRITQILSEVGNTLRRLILEEVSGSCVPKYGIDGVCNRDISNGGVPNNGVLINQVPNDRLSNDSVLINQTPNEKKQELSTTSIYPSYKVIQ